MGTLLNSTILPVDSTSNFIHTVQDSGFMYLLFSAGICIYAENTALTFIGFLNFLNYATVTSIYSMDVY
jgi:hypothetical protein